MVAALAVAAAFGCRPAPGLGTVSLVRGGRVHAIDLATCRDRVSRAPRARPAGPLRAPDGRRSVRVRVMNGRQTIEVVTPGKPTDRLLSLPAWSPTARNGSPGPIMLLGWTPDSLWVLFAIDPYGSASLVADGLRIEAVDTWGVSGRVPVADALAYGDYRAWCGGRLVLTAGGDRIATHHKQLRVTGPRAWRARPLVRAPGRAWGSLACSPDGRSVVVQSQPDSEDANFFHTRWALWRVGLDGSERRLTSPPPGYADESPRISRDGRTILFVRSRRGVGRLYALRGTRLIGPLLSLGYSLGYYGHQDWWQSADWSLGR